MPLAFIPSLKEFLQGNTEKLLTPPQGLCIMNTEFWFSIVKKHVKEA